MENTTVVTGLNMLKHFNHQIFRVLPCLELSLLCNRHIVSPIRNSAKNELALKEQKVLMRGKVLQMPEQYLHLAQIIRLNRLIRWRDYMLQLHEKADLVKTEKAG